MDSLRRLPIVRAFYEDRTYWILVAWLVVVFLFGGSSRADVLPLLLLRPLSVLVLAYGLAGLTGEQLRENRFLLGMAAAWVALPLLQLVPLPPSIWHDLPGREIVRDVDREAGLGDVWRPLSMVPYATMNAAWALLLPIATLVLGVRIEGDQRAKLLLPIIMLGFLSAGLGVLQMIGDPNGPLYFYRFTNHGSPVGLLANRNHQAALLACLMPMLAAWTLISAGQGRGFFGKKHEFRNHRRRRLNGFGWLQWLPTFAGAAIIVPLILVSGSRAGIALGLIALLSVPLLLSLKPRSATPGNDEAQSRISKEGWISLLFLAALIVLAVIAAMAGRAISFDRLQNLGASEDLRIRALPVVLSLIRTYALWGTGLGTFEQVYYLREPDNLLSDSYMNHAHNDWLEVALTGGLPGVVLAILSLGSLVPAVLRLATSRQGERFSRPLRLAGAVMLVIFGIASVTDYPLRVPSLACLGVLAVLWIKSGQIPPRSAEPSRSSV